MKLKVPINIRASRIRDLENRLAELRQARMNADVNRDQIEE